jgi:radical SAM superfamily enzyme YgiQ (UPF0313 family)
MKVLLINPPFTRIRRAGQSAFFPLGLGYLAGTLAAEGFEPAIYSAENCRPGEPLPALDMRDVFELRSWGHANFVAALADDDHFVWREVREVLERERPDVVGVSALSVQFGPAAKIARLVKQWREDCPVVFGGHHATYLPEDSLRREPAFDVVALGEGEQTMLELCQAYQRGAVDYSAIPGLAWRANGGVRYSERRALIPDLDALPMPRRDLVLFPESYLPHHFASIIYGRGCPWACRFCSSQVFWHRRTRYRSAEDCLEEIAALRRDFDLDHFMFWDDAISVRRKNIAEFCRAAIQSDQSFTFATATRANLVDEELMDLLKRAGCVELFLGVESGSRRVLEMINKDLDLDVLRRAVRLIEKNQVALGAFFMAGFPRETAEDLERTFELIKELKHARVSLPGSSLYDECIELGLVDRHADWADFPLWPDTHYTTEMEPEEFDAMAREMAHYVFKRNDSFMARVRRGLPLLVHNPRVFFGKLHGLARRKLGRGPRCPQCPPPSDPTPPHESV